MSGTPIIEIRDFCKTYGKDVAVDGISFTVHTGEIFGLLGPNGAGKTTTLENAWKGCVPQLPERCRWQGSTRRRNFTSCVM